MLPKGNKTKLKSVLYILQFFDPLTPSSFGQESRLTPSSTVHKSNYLVIERDS